MRRVAQVGIELIKAYEGLGDGDPSTVNLDPYLCPAGIWTIGWGHTIVDPKTGKRLTKANCTKEEAFALYPGGITREEAELLLNEDLKPREEVVQRLVRVELNDNQFAALVSFVYNVGAPAFQISKLLKKLNAGDFGGAVAEFPKWNKITTENGKVENKGLTNRREAERMRFVTPLFKAPIPVSKTPEGQGQILASVGIVGSALSEMTDSVGVAYTQLHSLGIEIEYIKFAFVALTLFGVAYTFYSRVKARNDKGSQ